MDKNCLLAKALAARKRFNTGQRMWSFAHHSTLFGSIICSVYAGWLIHGDGSSPQSAIASLLTTIAAALTGIATSSGFHRKWINNRLSRSRIDALLIDLMDDNADVVALARQLKQIILTQDDEIVHAEDKNKTSDGDCADESAKKTEAC
ncbi:MAG TPA: hypothetical protein VGK97_06215 [Spongiibacteraceae bacterium]|jgi:hypothetical protein